LCKEMNSYNLVEKAFAVIFQGLTVIARVIQNGRNLYLGTKMLHKW